MRVWPWFCQFLKKVSTITGCPLYSMSTIDRFDCISRTIWFLKKLANVFWSSWKSNKDRFFSIFSPARICTMPFNISFDIHMKLKFVYSWSFLITYSIFSWYLEIQKVDFNNAEGCLSPSDKLNGGIRTTLKRRTVSADILRFDWPKYV